MPPESRSTRVTERCESHPTRAAVADCARCGRRLCLACAVPVRGEVVGPECLSEVLGNEAPAAAIPGRRRSGLEREAGIACVVAILVTIFPWTRFSTGSGFPGAWALDARWSMLAACASVVGLAAWLLVGRRRSAVAEVAVIASAALVAAGGALAFWNPPPFTKPSLAPLVAVVAGLAAAATGAWTLRRSRGVHV